jgi:hypothetical protein
MEIAAIRIFTHLRLLLFASKNWMNSIDTSDGLIVVTDYAVEFKRSFSILYVASIGLLSSLCFRLLIISHQQAAPRKTKQVT